MANTTNYNWETPDDTDLVKDGAAAIRTLGSSIDSTVFTNASNAINKTIVDAKGDLIAATAADTVSRLAVGTNNQVLMADSTTATGLRWGTPAAGSLTLLSTTSLTGQNVTVTGISQDYTDLIVSIYGLQFSANSRPIVEFRNGTTAQNAVYGGRNGGADDSFNDTGINVTGTTNMPNNENTNNFLIYVKNYKSTTYARRNITVAGVYYNTGFAITPVNFSGVFFAQAAINAVFLDLPGSTTFTTGTVEIWGVN